MKFLADENFPLTVVSYLQKSHHNVKRIFRVGKGISDRKLKSIALKENRILLTLDKDFLVRTPKEAEISVILLSLDEIKSFEVIQYIDEVIQIAKELKRKKKPFIAVYSKKGLKLD